MRGGSLHEGQLAKFHPLALKLLVGERWRGKVISFLAFRLYEVATCVARGVHTPLCWHMSYGPGIIRYLGRDLTFALHVDP